MTSALRKLSVNEAVAEFGRMVSAGRGPPATSGGELPVPDTPEPAEARYYRFAEELLMLACPDPRQCTDQRCRRGGLCRHFGDLRARQEGRRGGRPTRRTPGSDALRHAIWVYINASRRATPG
jgi:hypothetical protein